MGCIKRNKTESIRELLLKTVSKSPDLFCYYVAIQEAKELLGRQTLEEINKLDEPQTIKKIADG